MDRDAHHHDRWYVRTPGLCSTGREHQEGLHRPTRGSQETRSRGEKARVQAWHGVGTSVRVPREGETSRRISTPERERRVPGQGQVHEANRGEESGIRVRELLWGRDDSSNGVGGLDEEELILAIRKLSGADACCQTSLEPAGDQDEDGRASKDREMKLVESSGLVCLDRIVYIFFGV